MRKLLSLALLPVRIPGMLVAKRQRISPGIWALALIVALLGASLGFFVEWGLGLKVGLAGAGLLLVELWVVRDSPGLSRGSNKRRQARRKKNNGRSSPLLH